MNLPYKPVAAALRAFHRTHLIDDAVEAAAPYLMAQAWDEGVLAAVGDNDARLYEFITPNPYRPRDADIERYGLAGEDDEFIHGSRSYLWIKARQAEHPGSIITAKRDGVWNDYAEAGE